MGVEWQKRVCEEMMTPTNPQAFYWLRLICIKVGCCQEETSECLVLAWDEDMKKIGLHLGDCSQ